MWVRTTSLKDLPLQIHLPRRSRIPTKISLPCNFAENLPSQRVLNKFPYRPGFLPALRVAKARGLCLKNLDFVLDDISLGFLATRKQPQKRFKHLVQKLPGTDVIVLGVHGLYMRELHEIGFQFERLMTGQPLDSPHDLCWHGANPVVGHRRLAGVDRGRGGRNEFQADAS